MWRLGILVVASTHTHNLTGCVVAYICLDKCIPPLYTRNQQQQEAEWHTTGEESHIYPDFVKMAEAFGVPARRVVRLDDLRGAIREMLDTPGPFLLDVMVPHIEHVLPMIPGGGSFKDVIVDGDGTQVY